MTTRYADALPVLDALLSRHPTDQGLLLAAIVSQYELESATLDIEGRYVVVAPHWWLPSRHASFARRATIAATGPATGRFEPLVAVAFAQPHDA